MLNAYCFPAPVIVLPGFRYRVPAVLAAYAAVARAFRGNPALPRKARRVAAYYLKVAAYGPATAALAATCRAYGLSPTLAGLYLGGVFRAVVKAGTPGVAVTARGLAVTANFAVLATAA